jgi:predicted nucleic acid-binding protein
VAWYLDTSAAVKLVIAEAESAALRTWLNRRELVASDLLRIELLRAVRHHDPSSRLHAREVLEVVNLVRITPSVCDLAAELDPVVLRSLDAIHCATAISLGSDLEGVVAYDERMRQACRALGLSVESPMP